MHPFSYSPSSWQFYTSFASTQITATSGVAGMPATINTVSVREVHPHDQTHSQPLETVEGISIASVLIAYAAVRLAQRAMGRWQEPPILDSS